MGIFIFGEGFHSVRGLSCGMKMTNREFRHPVAYVGRAMSFKIIFLIALFAPLLLIAADVIRQGPKREPTHGTQLPP